MKQKQTKSSLIDFIYRNNPDYRLKDVKSIVDDFLAAVTDSLKDGQNVEIRGLGTFDLPLVKARKNAHNPRTGEKISIKSHYRVKFKPSSDLREAVKQIKVKKTSKNEKK